jgi:hypothetical protein
MSGDIEPARCHWLGCVFTFLVKSSASRAYFGLSTEQPFRATYFILFVNEIAQIFEYVRVLFYADNMKMFLPVRGFRDYLKIQGDLNSLVDGCGANSLEQNFGNCKSNTFLRLRGIILHSITDLGVVMDSMISFCEAWWDL